jgi:integrase/recombinase XerD
MRASELCALNVGDYNPQQARLLIQHGKGDKARAVYVGDVTRKALWKHLQARPAAKPGDALFNTARGGHLTRQNLRKLIAATGRRGCVEKAGVHRFRHTFAITFLRNGGNVLALQDLLGHESMSTVRIYAKLAELDLATAQRKASPADNWRL